MRRQLKGQNVYSTKEIYHSGGLVLVMWWLQIKHQFYIMEDSKNFKVPKGQMYTVLEKFSIQHSSLRPSLGIVVVTSIYLYY